MTVAGRIARKEMTELARDGRLRWTSAIVLALLALAVLAGWRQYREQRALRDAAQQATRRDWLAQTPKNPHAAAHYGIFAFKPQQPLSLADRGVDAYTGVATFLEAHKENDAKYRPAQDATALARFGEWTAAAVLQLLIPLLIVLTGFSAFTGERESGLLRQLVAAGASPRDLLLGKATGLVAALALVLLPAAVLGGAALAVAGGAGDVAARALLLVLAYAAYFAVFVAAALAVSARASSSRVALLILLGFWAINALVALRALADVSRRAVPTPSALAFNRSLEDELSAGAEGADAALERRLVRQFGVSSADSLPFNMRGFALQLREAHGYVAFDARYGHLHDAFARQNRLQALGGVLAPLASVRFLSMSLAGTDYEQHWDFGQAAERYRRSLVKRMNLALMYAPPTPGGDVRGDTALWASLPAFVYEPPPVLAVLEQQQASLWVLLLWVVAASLLARWSVTTIRIDAAAGT